MKLLLMLLAAGAGCCVAVQATVNTRLRDNLGHNPLFATFFSICGTFLTVIVVVLLLRPPVPTLDAMKQAPWWNWLGGPLGVLFVLAGAALVSELGAALFIALVVAGQLAASLAFDHFGLAGLPVTELTPGRVLGAVLVVTGVACMKYL